jgi:glyoxylase-like metal-dependent hydrolase (beta-lactamase superfamily II)
MNAFEPGRAVRLAPGVRRLVAPNASAMTGPGTNTYLLGEPPRAVLDPGPNVPAHLEAIAREVPQLEQVFVTHTHPDHSPAARALAARTGARLVGLRPPAGDPRQDATFTPDIEPQPEQTFSGDGYVLRAIRTPGHASNHVCYLHEAQRLLFSGDHVLDGVTPVILAPDGDMAAYLDSLERLKAYAIAAIAPGHGRLLLDPLRVIDGVIAHRLARERKVLDALGALGGGTLDELLAVVYADVPGSLHSLARFSLDAHLIKLVREGRCRREADRYLTVPVLTS